MSKEIKEKCKECVYYNDKIEYPNVNGTTTHSNCRSIKCEYRKITKDMQISRLKHDLVCLEAKLAESEKQVEFYKEENKINKKDCDYYFDEYTLCKRKIKDLEQENSELHIAINMSIPTQIAMKGEIERLHTCIDDRIAELVKENEQLKQQLAEKYRRIEQLKKFDDLNKTFFDLFRTAFKEPNKVDDLLNTLKTMQEKQDQDKISFAVEQLENCRLNLIKLLNKKRVYLDSSTTDEMDDLFDNQIKQLRVGK